jgi:hypothetical protein
MLELKLKFLNSDLSFRCKRFEAEDDTFHKQVLWSCNVARRSCEVARFSHINPFSGTFTKMFQLGDFKHSFTPV